MSNWHDACDLLKSQSGEIKKGWWGRRTGQEGKRLIEAEEFEERTGRKPYTPPKTPSTTKTPSAAAVVTGEKTEKRVEGLRSPFKPITSVTDPGTPPQRNR